MGLALRRDGTLVRLGGSPTPRPPPQVFQCIMGRKRLAGSSIGGIQGTQQMLDVCAAPGIVSDIEVIVAKDINVAYERMLKSDVKYWFVIDVATIAA